MLCDHATYALLILSLYFTSALVLMKQKLTLYTETFAKTQTDVFGGK